MIRNEHTPYGWANTFEHSQPKWMAPSFLPDHIRPRRDREAYNTPRGRPQGNLPLATDHDWPNQPASNSDRTPRRIPITTNSQPTQSPPTTRPDPFELFPHDEGYDNPCLVESSDFRCPVVKIPRDRTAEIEVDIAIARGRVAVAEEDIHEQLVRVDEAISRFRQTTGWINGSTRTHATPINQPSTHLAQPSPPRRETARTRPLLHVFGDSFVGPFTLYQTSEVRVTKYKGASAQGLGNPHSALQIGPKLSHSLREYIMAPGNRPKAALLMFGSVDLHINHLHHVTTTSIARHLPLEQRKGSTAPFDQQAMTGIEYAQRAFESYARFLFQAIVLSDIGEYVRDHVGGDSASRILIAAAAPPMVQDEYLEAIRLKYILPHEAKPKDWAERPSFSSAPSSPSASRASTPASSCSSLPSSIVNKVDTPLSVNAILRQNLGLLDLTSRIEATRHFNTELREFCERHDDVLLFVDITPRMGLPGGAQPANNVEVDRATFGDKADLTNVHVDWETTLPLWEDELWEAGVSVDEFRLRTSLAETARAFNVEKSERVKRRSWRLDSDPRPKALALKVEDPAAESEDAQKAKGSELQVSVRVENVSEISVGDATCPFVSVADLAGDPSSGDKTRRGSASGIWP